MRNIPRRIAKLLFICGNIVVLTLLFITIETNHFSSKTATTPVPKRFTLMEHTEALTTKRPVHLFPAVPTYSKSDYVQKIDRRLIQRYLFLPKRNYTEEVVILTPIRNVAKNLPVYKNQLQQLTYPHHLISVVLGEDGSGDDTLEVAKNVVQDLVTSHGFKYAFVVHFNTSKPQNSTWNTVHSYANQLDRRKHLAISRNMVLKYGLKNQSWVLWIDSDVSVLPHDLVEQLLYPDADVVVPLCLYNDDGNFRVYDKNTWRETKKSIAHQKELSNDSVIFEGYSATKRLYLHDLRGEGRVVTLDGVGGCALLVRAQCHKKGLIFPEWVFDHHIETEGLAKMAKHLRFKIRGLPFVEVIHA